MTAQKTDRWIKIGTAIFAFVAAVFCMGSTFGSFSAQHNLDLHAAEQNGSLGKIELRLDAIDARAEKAEVRAEHIHDTLEEILMKLPK